MDSVRFERTSLAASLDRWSGNRPSYFFFCIFLSVFLYFSGEEGGKAEFFYFFIFNFSFIF